MRWYWWVLIAVGVVLIGWLKISVYNKWMQRRKEKSAPIEDE